MSTTTRPRSGRLPARRRIVTTCVIAAAALLTTIVGAGLQGPVDPPSVTTGALGPLVISGSPPDDEPAAPACEQEGYSDRTGPTNNAETEGQHKHQQGTRLDDVTVSVGQPRVTRPHADEQNVCASRAKGGER